MTSIAFSPCKCILSKAGLRVEYAIISTFQIAGHFFAKNLTTKKVLTLNHIDRVLPFTRRKILTREALAYASIPTLKVVK